MLLNRVRRFASRHDLWRPSTRVLAAVSGGSDSVAMLSLLHDLHQAGDLRLDAVAHLNHGIRPEAADDEAFCRELANRLRVPFIAECVDVPARARRARQSIELAGRVARREFLDAVRSARGADRIATAHTADDQAETVLLRLLRGTGTRGLGGMAPRNGVRIRPLLDCSRTELQDHLRQLGQSWREDATNRDVTQPRNRVRHDLLPRLERTFNPSVRQALARLADVARADDEMLAREAAVQAAASIERTDEGIRLRPDDLARVPEALRRRVLQHAVRAARPAPAPTAEEVAAIAAVLAGEAAAAEISGVRAEHSGADVVLVIRGAGPAPFWCELPVPGWVEVAGHVVEAAWPGPRDDLPQTAVDSSGTEVSVAADELELPLVVRNRQPGDWLRPSEKGGRRKLQDLFVDRKVPRRQRDRVPVVTDRRGRIVWVAGVALSKEFMVSDGTKAVIILKLRRI